MWKVQPGVEMVHPGPPVHPDRQHLPQFDLLHLRSTGQHQLPPELLVEQHLVLVHFYQLSIGQKDFGLRLSSFDCLSPHLSCK